MNMRVEDQLTVLTLSPYDVDRIADLTGDLQNALGSDYWESSEEHRDEYAWLDKLYCLMVAASREVSGVWADEISEAEGEALSEMEDD